MRPVPLLAALSILVAPALLPAEAEACSCISGPLMLYPDQFSPTSTTVPPNMHVILETIIDNTAPRVELLYTDGAGETIPGQVVSLGSSLWAFEPTLLLDQGRTLRIDVTGSNDSFAKEVVVRGAPDRTPPELETALELEAQLVQLEGDPGLSCGTTCDAWGPNTLRSRLAIHGAYNDEGAQPFNVIFRVFAFLDNEVIPTEPTATLWGPGALTPPPFPQGGPCRLTYVPFSLHAAARPCVLLELRDTAGNRAFSELTCARTEEVKLDALENGCFDVNPPPPPPPPDAGVADAGGADGSTPRPNPRIGDLETAESSCGCTATAASEPGGVAIFLVFFLVTLFRRSGS